MPALSDKPEDVALPPRHERVAAVRALMGPADPAVRQLAEGIRAITRRHFDLQVLPLVRAHWPAMLDEPFYEKLRIGACDLYASAPYTVLFCAPRQPLLVRVVTLAGAWLPLPGPVLALLGRGALEVLGRLALADEHRRIILIASFIMVVDHVLDHALDDPPDQRGARIEAVIAGRQPATTPPLALARALIVAIERDLHGEPRRAFAAALGRLYDWIRAEVRAMKGEPDPLGLGHHLAGVEGGIDGLLFPVVRYTGEGARRWMYDVSMFMQIMDDWLDYEIDLRSNRATPVMAGQWTMADVTQAWQRTLDGLEALVRAAGPAPARYRRFVREAYVRMMVEVMDAMAQRPAL